MRKQDQSGFTLLEVLIAVAIFSLLMTAVWLSLDVAVETRNSLANTATPYTVGPAILDRLSEDLANVYFYDFNENNSFYGADSDLLAREADALSFIALSKSFAPDFENYPDLSFDRPKFSYGEFFEDAGGGRWSYSNEVSYVCRSQGNGFLELWRREDWHVDDYPHADGEYVLLYDKVHSIQLQYISRNDATADGVGASRAKDTEEMIQDGWNSVEERGIPRAVLVTLQIYAQDSIRAVEDQIEMGEEPKIYTFRRYITLPQVHMSLGVQNTIADWDGQLRTPTVNVANGGRGGPGGRGGNAGGGRGGGDRGGAAGRGGRGGNQRINFGRGGNPRQGGNPGANPFLNALRGAGRGGGGRPAGNLGSIFGGAGGRR